MANKSCILTVIKNEQEYLDEWIKYHLDLGIDHIFVFEDIDSEPHKHITDKYGDKVSINKIDIVLDEHSKKEIIDFKISKRKNPQEIYFPKGMKWIQSVYPNKYNWCFVIDNDEFITFEKENAKLEDVLKLYDGYDAFVLQWKIYGANGHIYKPDYGDKGLIGTYTKESSYPGHHVLEWTTKTCYNLNTFKEIYFRGNHQPTDVCKWCKTDFSKLRTKLIYDTVYIRHYMTKSWEEYVSKRKRGYFMGFARTIDLFFMINPDMNFQRNELIKQIKDEVLVVLPYKQSGSQGNEIRLTLKGWKKFCRFKYHFIVIGEFNDSLKNEFPWVEFIYCPTREKKEGQYNPHLDIQNKFKVVMRMYSQIYDGFIYMTDDEYAVKPFNLEDITRIYNHSSNFIGNEKSPTSYWSHDKWKTRQLLDKERLPHINYTTHYPCYFEFNKLNIIWKKFNMLEESYVFDDVYFNYFPHEEPILDSTIRLGIWNNDIFKNDFKKAVDDPNIKFMCNSVEGWSKELENSLEKLINGNEQL
jgi:hypothetical protein